MLDNGRVGVAFTFHDAFAGGCGIYSGPLAGRRADELVEKLTDDNPLRAAVGLAAANALVNYDRPEFTGGDVTQALGIRPDDRVGMVGYFAPIMSLVRDEAAEVLVFEMADRTPPPEGLLGPAEAIRELPDCDVALITSTALLNGTLPGLLDACRNCRETALLGTSTPMCPEVFACAPVTMLSGAVVVRPQDLMQAVSEGGGRRAFKGMVRKVNCRTGENRNA
jgi:uncharacterized protein (DUF4213/DUF364 family)